MALVVQQTNKALQTNRTKFVLIGYGLLAWFALVLSASVLGAFARYPLVFYVAVGGPIALYLAAYLPSAAFRRFVHSLVGDPWAITVLQVYRVLGLAMAVQALRNIVPAMFGLPAGFGDFFIGMTALLVALAWARGGRFGRRVFVLWNLLGILDLLVAVSMAVLAGLTQATDPITMAPMREFPLSLVPVFGVPLAFILHCTGLAQAWYLSRKQAL